MWYYLLTYIHPHTRINGNGVSKLTPVVLQCLGYTVNPEESTYSYYHSTLLPPSPNLQIVKQTQTQGNYYRAIKCTCVVLFACVPWCPGNSWSITQRDWFLYPKTLQSFFIISSRQTVPYLFQIRIFPWFILIRGKLTLFVGFTERTIKRDPALSIHKLLNALRSCLSFRWW